jgi:HEPN domain-containing protein
MDRNEEIRQWFSIAVADLNIAAHAFENMWPKPNEPICFHCQQSAEKDLKGFLKINNIEPPKIHNLEELRKTCEEINPEFNLLYAKCAILNKYSVMTRYPVGLEIIDEDSKAAIQYAKDIKTFVTALVTIPDVNAAKI